MKGIVEVTVVPDKDTPKYKLAINYAKAREIDTQHCLAIEDSQEGVNEAGIYKIPRIVVPTEFTDKPSFYGTLFKINNLKNNIR